MLENVNISAAILLQLAGIDETLPNGENGKEAIALWIVDDAHIFILTVRWKTRSALAITAVFLTW